jgi:hypothetical protein
MKQKWIAVGLIGLALAFSEPPAIVPYARNAPTLKLQVHASAGALGEEPPKWEITIQEYHHRVNVALRPVFLPLVTQWIQHRYGAESRASIRTIGFEENGVINVHVDAKAANRTCIFSFFYEWKNGWKLVKVDNYSASASGCA